MLVLLGILLIPTLAGDYEILLGFAGLICGVVGLIDVFEKER